MSKIIIIHPDLKIKHYTTNKGAVERAGDAAAASQRTDVCVVPAVTR